jgi:nicotinamide mononucleotide (NMN) deamidase PncC
LGSLIFGEGEETLEGVVAGLLEQKGIHLGLVETLTAGRISQRLQNRRTRFFKGGWVIPQEGDRPLDSSRLSGEEKALTQAREIRSFLESDWGLAVLVEEVEGRQVLYLGLAGTKEESYSHKIGGFSNTLPDRVAVMALDWLRKKLTKEI